MNLYVFAENYYFFPEINGAVHRRAQVRNFPLALSIARDTDFSEWNNFHDENTRARLLLLVKKLAKIIVIINLRNLHLSPIATDVRAEDFMLQS